MRKKEAAVQRGDVWQVRLTGGGGHAQAGDRPAVVLQHRRYTQALPMALIVPFTSRQKTLHFPGTVLVQPDGSNGLTLPSVALVFQLTALDTQFFLRHLGVLDPHSLDQILATLDQLIR
jgi:mRNA interferase MazF